MQKSKWLIFIFFLYKKNIHPFILPHSPVGQFPWPDDLSLSIPEL